MSLTIALPGLIWPDAGDIDYLYKNLKNLSLNKFIKNSSTTYHDYNYSDFLYNINFNKHCHTVCHHKLYPEQKADNRILITENNINCHPEPHSGSTNSNTTLAQKTAKELHVNHEFKHFLFAEPTHLRIDRDRLLISEAELLQLNQTECNEIISAINKHFTPDFKLYYFDEHLWLLGLNIDPSDEKFYPIIDIIGENINDYLPSHNNSLLYNKFLNEVQMLLFGLSVNKIRGAEGSLAVSSLWLWDKSPIKLSSEYTQIFANNNLSMLKHDKISPPPCNLQDIFNTDWQHKQKTDAGKYNTEDNIDRHPGQDPGAIGGKSKTLIIIDTLYYPSCYRDSYSWRAKMEEIDEKVFAALAKLKIKNYTLLVPMQNKTLELSKKSIFGIFSKNNLITLAKEWHET